MKEIIHFSVFLMKHFERAGILGKAISTMISQLTVEYIGEDNLNLLEQEVGVKCKPFVRQ